MATWNKKQRAEMADMQRKLGQGSGHPKRQVLCRQCEKVHDHPVCHGAHAMFVRSRAANQPPKR